MATSIAKLICSRKRLPLSLNQFQELLCADFERVGRQERVDLPLYGLNNQTNKQVRFRRLGPYLSQRKLRFKSRSPGTALLVQQLKDFPVGDHDDGPDPLEMAFRLSIELWNGRFAMEQRVSRLITNSGCQEENVSWR
jgi:predicted phage terminase large subunit-like protein